MKGERCDKCGVTGPEVHHYMTLEGMGAEPVQSQEKVCRECFERLRAEMQARVDDLLAPLEGDEVPF